MLDRLFELDYCGKMVACGLVKVAFVLPPCAKSYVRNAPAVTVAALSS